MTQMMVTKMFRGTIALTIRVNFHCTAKATTKAATKVEMACIVKPSFSEMPLLTRFPFVVIWLEIEDEGESKKGISCLRDWRTKSTRRRLIALMLEIETRTVQMYTRKNLAMKRYRKYKL